MNYDLGLRDIANGRMGTDNVIELHAPTPYGGGYSYMKIDPREKGILYGHSYTDLSHDWVDIGKGYINARFNNPINKIVFEKDYYSQELEALYEVLTEFDGFTDLNQKYLSSGYRIENYAQSKEDIDLIFERLKEIQEELLANANTDYEMLDELEY